MSGLRALILFWKLNDREREREGKKKEAFISMCRLLVCARVRLTFRLNDIPQNECQLEDEPSAVYDVLYNDDQCGEIVVGQSVIRQTSAGEPGGVSVSMRARHLRISN